ncbi:hypothetical protein IAT38_002343 [Cryptococcus sp. DSM 104549]
MRTLPLLLLIGLPLVLADTAASSSSPPVDNTTEPSPPLSTSSPSAPSASPDVKPDPTSWDIGWSPRDQWVNLRDTQECSAPRMEQTARSAVDPSGTPLPNVSDQVSPSPEAHHPPHADADAKAPSPSSVEPWVVPPDDGFVSFEEWKRIKMAEEEEGPEADEEGAADSTPSSEGGPSTEPQASESPTEALSPDGSKEKVTNSSEPTGKASQHAALSTDSKAESSSSTSQSSSQQPSASPPAHHNRYNYASPDCSARIHSSSPQTQHASSLLHKSRDRYMLTPCKAKEHWVVVELCDEIRVEAIEVAVWEFFSGVVREVRVSVGGEDEDDEDEGSQTSSDVKGRGNQWKEVGSFIGKNVRGSQTFTLSSPTSFHRFIRLDFPSYYGTEYYCPVSQLKAYGMNQMEAFKWEQKQLSMGSKEKEKNRDLNKERELEERRERERLEKDKKEKEDRERQEQREKELDELEKLLRAQAGLLVPEDTLTESVILSSIAEENTPVATSTPPEATSTVSSSSASEPSHSPSAVNASTSSLSANVTASPNTSVSSSVSLSSVSLSSVSSKPADTTTSPPATSSTYSRTPPPRSDSSESIYAFIIRRLNALEGNSSLVARYIEEQAKVMRLMLKRVEGGWDDWKSEWEGEDRGRWEQERMRQEDRLGKVVSQLEQQRVAFEHERRAIQTQLRVLSDELSYERRRGIAMLFIMIVVIVLGVSTRSSTIDALLHPLLAEAKRRRSIYGRKSISGPLTGLRIDMGFGRPPAIIGQDRPQPRDPAPDPAPQPNRRDSLPSPTPTPRVRTQSTRERGTPSNRPLTPSNIRQRRTPHVMVPNLRSVSATEHLFPSASTSGQTSSFSLASPRPRGSLPPQRAGGGPPRRLARSAHLHTIDADRVRDKARQDARTHAKTLSLGEGLPSQLGEGGEEEMRRRPPRSSLQNHVNLTSSPGSNMGDGYSGGREDDDGAAIMSDRTVDDSQGEWGTDVETEASVSEIEDEVQEGKLRQERRNGIEKEEASHGVSEDVVKELSDIWRQPEKNTQHEHTPKRNMI